MCTRLTGSDGCRGACVHERDTETGSCGELVTKLHKLNKMKNSKLKKLKKTKKDKFQSFHEKKV